ncbi:adhesin [Virgibacillus profundi]|uniref:Adhesin n=1 Tax=Virgibacillus profundi TaxID=2024555 RepID=A0A2A2IAA6_9BACI|nr:zinc ABC transporter substrate-binding protein [Virgibacillus profundi]PAV28659.1 adhesin [Virgibacillus profundi]PXY52827.1 adhesin [Virgibacillus profundi]
MKILQAIMILLITAVIITGCASSNDKTNNTFELNIYTSVYPIQYAIERIGGDSISVKSVYPPGVDAHTYEPASKDITSIAKSDAFFYLGAGMEGFAESASEALKTQDVELIEIGQHEELFHIEDVNHEDEKHEHEEEHAHDGHSHGDQDPHIWIDPLRMLEMSSIIKDKLIELNPESEKKYTENFHELEQDLLTLHEQFINTLQGKSNKKILVSHAGYGYWEARYGIEQIAINGLSSSSEPSQKELIEVINQANKYNLDYIIFEQNSSNRVTEIIQEEIDAEALTIHNLSVLTDDDIRQNNNYLSLMKDNLEVLDKVTN